MKSLSGAVRYDLLEICIGDIGYIRVKAEKIVLVEQLDIRVIERLQSLGTLVREHLRSIYRKIRDAHRAGSAPVLSMSVFAGSDFAGDDICLDVVCICQPERHIDAANLGRLEILYFFRDKRPVFESLLNKTDGLLFADLKRNDEFRCFFLGNTVKDHAGAAAVDALRGGLGAVDRDLAAAGAAGVDVAVEELLGRLFIDAINFRSGDRLPVF